MKHNLRANLEARRIEAIGEPAVILPMDKVSVYSSNDADVLIMTLADLIEWLDSIDVPIEPAMTTKPEMGTTK